LEPSIVECIDEDLDVHAKKKKLLRLADAQFLVGGIADGRGLAAVLALGAAGAWIGTRFLASREATIHPRYRERLLSATKNDTVFLEELFDVGWRKAPHRVLRNKTVETWEAAGQPPSGARPGEGEVIAKSRSGGEIVGYQSCTPGTDTEGDIDALSLWAGQSVGLVSEIKPGRRHRSRDRRAGAEHAGQVGAVKLCATAALGHCRLTITPGEVFLGLQIDGVLDPKHSCV
jgi:hypothetical protein